MSLGMKKTIKKLLIGILVLGFLFSIKIQGAELKEEVIDIGNGVKLEMVLIPAGKFIMGSTKDREEAVLKEKFKNSGEEEARISKWAEDNAASLTQHEVTISKQFYMGKFEVTIEQWYAMSGGIKPDGYEKLNKKLPVRYVSKEKINSILAQFNKRTSDKLLAKFDTINFCTDYQRKQSGNMLAERELPRIIHLGIRSRPRMQTILIQR
jgi:hypothetical protein